VAKIWEAIKVANKYKNFTGVKELYDDNNGQPTMNTNNLKTIIDNRLKETPIYKIIFTTYLVK